MNLEFVNTVTGPVRIAELGLTLMHEHILFGYSGWEGDRTVAPFDREAALEAGVGYLDELKGLGVTSFVDATPLDGGRAPELYREISRASGVNVICSTGYYYEGGGGSAYFRMRSRMHDTLSEVTELFLTELTRGIGDTGIKAGVIKVGSSKGTITDYEKMMFKAAARAQAETGVPIITHTEQGTMGPEQAELLVAEGADPALIQIGHMSDNLDLAYQLKTLEQGVYVAWDRMGLQGIAGCPTDEERYPVLQELIERGYGNRIMLSQDFVRHWLGRPWIYPDEMKPLLANRRPGSLLTGIIPAMVGKGMDRGALCAMLTENPRRFFAGRR